MNCKPGQLALVVGGMRDDGSMVAGVYSAIVAALMGRVVRVVRLRNMPHLTNPSGNVWDFEEAINLPGSALRLPERMHFTTGVANVTVTGMDDSFLRPLPDLDEDLEREHDAKAKGCTGCTVSGVKA